MNPKNEKPQCSVCIYFNEIYDQCRFHSPQVAPEKDSQLDNPNDLNEDNPGNWPHVAYDSSCGKGKFRMIQHSQESKQTFALLPTLLSYAQWVREQHTDEWWTRATYHWPRV